MKNYELAKKDYESGMKYKDIATKYEVSISTVKSWKARYWKNDEVAIKSERVASKKKKVAIKKAIEQLDDSRLTEKQKLFCLYYLQRFNATWAYQKAYGGANSTARTEGSRTLANPNVKLEIERLKKQQATDLYLDSNDILKEYAKQAFASLGDILDYTSYEELVTDNNGMPIPAANGDPIKHHFADIHLKPSDEIDWSTVQDLHVGKDGLVVKLYDKQKAMHELLERLPEPTNENVEEDTFLTAINEATDRIEKEDDNET